MGASALGGCNDTTGGNPPPDGVLTVDVQPANMPPAGLTITGGRMEIEGLTVLGDVAPTGQSMVHEFSLDLTSTGASFSLSALPQGLYSRVRLVVDHATLDGSWRGASLHVAVGTDDSSAGAVDLRSNGVEVTPGHNGELAVAVDAGAWFADNVLDGATPDATGALVVDGLHNATVAATIAARIPASFSLKDSTAVQ